MIFESCASTFAVRDICHDRGAQTPKIIAARRAVVWTKTLNHTLLRSCEQLLHCAVVDGMVLVHLTGYAETRSPIRCILFTIQPFLELIRLLSSLPPVCGYDRLTCSATQPQSTCIEIETDVPLEFYLKAWEGSE